jgi:2-polyprenyl-3-methyl-5-hydroxy-6-metoxy-1,4-benzoquinol methylase
MGPGKKHFAKICLESVKDADKILYWTNKALDFQTENTIYRNLDIFFNGWDEQDPATNGKCRQRYLEYLKKNYPDDWCLVLDEDEILEEDGIKRIKQFINEREPGLYNVKMRHFIGDLGHEDATRPVHVVPCRLFKISEAIKYPEHSHSVLEGELKGACLDTTIWHLGHLPVEYLDYIKHRYKQHLKDSIIHTKQFLTQWYLNHLFGQYPVKQIDPTELPKIICDRYELDKDQFYFENRGLEVKHFIMTKQWKNYFQNKNVLACGCGRGPYLCAWNAYDVEAFGFDKSKFAVMNPINANTQMWIDDITKFETTQKFDLVTAIDILEHLEYEDLEKALIHIHKTTKKFVLFSIPFEGDPNLELDPTHIIKEGKEWWINRLSRYFKIKDAPQDWLFHEQLLIGEKIGGKTNVK